MLNLSYRRKKILKIHHGRSSADNCLTLITYSAYLHCLCSVCDLSPLFLSLSLQIVLPLPLLPTPQKDSRIPGDSSSSSPWLSAPSTDIRDITTMITNPISRGETPDMMPTSIVTSVIPKVIRGRVAILGRTLPGQTLPGQTLPGQTVPNTVVALPSGVSSSRQRRTPRRTDPGTGMPLLPMLEPMLEPMTQICEKRSCSTSSSGCLV